MSIRESILLDVNVFLISFHAPPPKKKINKHFILIRWGIRESKHMGGAWKDMRNTLTSNNIDSLIDIG
jgi:hypothetical protein